MARQPIKRRTAAERAADPDTRPEDLARLVGNHPDAVLGNPILPLVSLEDPAAGQALRAAAERGSLAARLIRARDALGAEHFRAARAIWEADPRWRAGLYPPAPLAGADYDRMRAEAHRAELDAIEAALGAKE